MEDSTKPKQLKQGLRHLSPTPLDRFSEQSKEKDSPLGSLVKSELSSELGSSHQAETTLEKKIGFVARASPRPLGTELH